LIKQTAAMENERSDGGSITDGYPFYSSCCLGVMAQATVAYQPGEVTLCAINDLIPLLIFSIQVLNILLRETLKHIHIFVFSTVTSD
jgi:hypothetical protein